VKRYLKLFGSALVLGVALMLVARTVHMPAPAAPKVAEIPSVDLALTLTKQGLSPENSSVPKDHRVRLSIVNRRRDRVGLALHGYQDKLMIGWIEPDSTWRGEFLADRPGEGFAWELGGEPVGKLSVLGSHLVDGHR
jgi:hypothetical protein